MRKLLYILIFITLIDFTFSQNIDSVKIHLIDKINDYRISKGKEKVIFNNYLTNTAKNHSDYTKNEFYEFSNKVISHIQNNTSNKYFLAKTPHDRCGCSEITQKNTQTSQDKYYKNDERVADIIFNLWKKSPPHNKAMLDDRYRYYGCGISIKESSLGINIFTTIHFSH